MNIQNCDDARKTLYNFIMLLDPQKIRMSPEKKIGLGQISKEGGGVISYIHTEYTKI